MKRIAAFILALVLALCVGPLPSSGAAEEPVGEEIRALTAEDAISLSMENGKLKASYTGPAGKTALLIAAAYDTEGRMRKASTLSCAGGESVSFEHDRDCAYRVFAVEPGTYIPICEAESEIRAFSGDVEVPYLSGASASALSIAVRRAAEARRLLDELLALDPTKVYGDKEKLDAYLGQVDNAIEAYEALMQAGAVLYYAADQAAAEQEQAASALARLLGEPARTNSSEEEQRHWAEELTKKFDSVQGNMKLAALGKMLGCDAREAYEQLTAAQDILRGHYLEEAASADRWVKGLTVVKTTSKVALLVGGIAVTGGAVAIAEAPAAIAGATLTAGQTVGLLVGVTDAVIDVGKTGATLVFGDDHAIVKHLEDKTKPFGYVSFAFSLMNLGSASAPEVVAFLGDCYENLRNVSPGTVDKLEKAYFEQGKLFMGVNSIINPLGTVGTLINDLIEHPGDVVAKADVERLEENRPEITDELVEQTLKDARVLEEGETLEDFGEKQEEFEKEAAEELAEKKSKESGSTVTYHDERSGFAGVYRDCYYMDGNGNYVGIRECYYGDVLVDRYSYSEDGTIQWRDSFSSSTGRITHHTEYTNGLKPGSIETTIEYLNDGEGEEGAVKNTKQYLFYSYTDEEGKEHDSFECYYGTWVNYHYHDGNYYLEEVYTGSGGKWAKTEGYDKEGKLSYMSELDESGSGVTTHYFTECPQDWEWFDPTGSPKMKQTWVPYYAEADSRPHGYEEELTREEWELGSWQEDILNEAGEKIGYTEHHGYKYFSNTLNGYDYYNYGRIDVTEPVAHYYD